MNTSGILSLLPELSFFPSSKQTNEVSFALFLTAQMMVCALLAIDGALTLGVASCLSLSVLMVARLTVRSLCAPIAAADTRNGTSLSLVGIRGAPRHHVRQSHDARAELMARISHEIRTPLNAVIGFADLMDGEMFGPLGSDRYRSYARHIKESGQLLLKSAEDTLALSTLLASHDDCPQASAIADLLSEAWTVVAPLAVRSHIEIVGELVPKIQVIGDRRALRQALANIMTEAAKRAAPGTQIALKVDVIGDAVGIRIHVPATVDQIRAGGPSLELCLAQTLLELNGAELQTQHTAKTWTGKTNLQAIVQSDLFCEHRCTKAA